MQVVPAASPLKSSHKGTGRRDLVVPQTVHTERFEEQVAGKLVFKAKVASSHDGTTHCRDQSQGLVSSGVLTLTS